MKLLLVISAIAQGILLSNPEPISMIVTSAITGLLAVWLVKAEKRKISPAGKIAIALLDVCIGAAFYIRIQYANDQTQLWNPLLMIITILLCAGSYGFAVTLTEAILEKPASQTTGHPTEHITWHLGGLCFLCSLICVTFCSECSFLYPINSWVDANCFFTVGKSMMRGIVPYRDLLEQKGPVLYLLYGAASLINSKAFTGVYLLEVISGTIFLYYSAKTVALYTERKDACYLTVPLAAVIVFCSGAFHKGGSTEEFSLPLIAYTLYLGLRQVKNSKAIRFRESVLTGVAIGCVLWSKFTLLGFFLGWVLCFLILYIQQRQYRVMLRMVSGIIIGMILVTAPVMIYFARHQALSDLFEVYFYDNIFLYPGIQETSFIRGLAEHYIRGGAALLKGCVFAVVFALISLTGITDKRERLLIILPFGLLFFASFIGKWSWEYYTLPFLVFLAPGFGMIFSRIQTRVGKLAPLLAGVCLLCFFMTENHSRMLVRKEETVQYSFAETIQDSEHSTLLNYGFLDGGFYLAADVLPTCKAFCELAAPIPEMYQAQKECLDKGKCEFVVSVKALSHPLYEEIREKDGYRLYRRFSEAGSQ